MLQKGKFYPILVCCSIVDHPYDGGGGALQTLAFLEPDDIILFVETTQVPWMEGRYGPDRIQAWHKVVFGEVIGWMAGELGAMIDVEGR